MTWPVLSVNPTIQMEYALWNNGPMISGLILVVEFIMSRSQGSLVT